MSIWEKWNKEWKTAIERKLTENLILRFWASHTALAFCYGLFLFLYEVKFVRDIVTPVHPVLIAWAGTLVLYDIFVRNIWKQVPYWVPVFLFTVSTGITTLLTMEVGIVSGIKGMIFAALPLYAFFPVCILQEKSKRKNTFVLCLLGAAVVIFVASAAALGLYAVRFGGYVDIGSMREFVGMRFYIPTDPTTGILLYGLYVDTNHAAMFALVFIAYGIFLLVSGCQSAFDRKWKNISAIVFGAVSTVTQLCYFPLANSRGAWLALAIGVFVVVFIAAFCGMRIHKGPTLKLVISIIAAAAATCCVSFGMLMLRSGIVQLPDIVDRIAASIQSVQTPATPEITEPDEMPTEDKILTDMELADTTNVTNVNFDKGQVSLDGSRFLIWKEALQLFAKNPVFGTSPSGNQYYAQKYQVGLEKIGNGAAIHNSFLDLLLDYGFVGFMLVMSFWVMCAVAVLRNRFKKMSPNNPVWYVAVFTVIVTLCASMTLSCTFINTTAMYFLMIVAASYLMSDIQ